MLRNRKERVFSEHYRCFCEAWRSLLDILKCLSVQIGGSYLGGKRKEKTQSNKIAENLGFGFFSF